MRPKALVAEDEPVLRTGLRKMLAAAWPELEIVALPRDGTQAIELLERHRPHVLFLDIQMPGLSGLDVAKAASGRCHVVFITAYDQYAVAAFEEGAVDYVMKPFDVARLTKACKRVRERLNTPPANLESLLAKVAQLVSRNRDYLRWINIESGRNVRLITVEEVCYFQADVKYTRVVTADHEALIRTPLKEAPRRARPFRLPANPPLDNRQFERDRRGRPGHARTALPAAQEPQGDLAGEPAVRTPVPADVTEP